MKIISLKEVAEEGVSHNPEIRKQTLLRKGALPHLLNFARSRLAPGQAASAHRHKDMFEVFFVEAGAGRLKIDGHDQPLEAGTCFVVEPGEEHEIINDGTSDLWLIYFGIEE